MKLFEGKTPTERNKIILAAVLGVLALFALYAAFGGSFFSSSKTKASASPTPKPSPSVSPNPGNFVIPTQSAQDLQNSTTLINYNGETVSAPDAGRNIFAFYEPPPYSPTPTPEPVIKTPVPIPPPTPNVFVTFVQPQGVYAGTKAFRMEVSGDKFTPDVRIFFQGSEMPTNFISALQLSTDVPANFIAQEGSRIIEVRSPDGKLWSNQISFNIQAAPRPQFQYIGMIARKRGNNDTAYFQETGKTTNPFGARLNDVIGNRFRLVSISSGETVFEDTSLGFRHKLTLTRPAPGTGTGGGLPGSRPAQTDSFPPGFSNPFPNPNGIPQNPAGIPANIPRANPQMPANTKRTLDPKKDVDDDDDDDGDN